MTTTIPDPTRRAPGAVAASLPRQRSERVIPPSRLVTDEDDRLKVVLHQLLRARDRGAAAQLQHAEDTLIALLFVRALDAANIAAAGLIAPLDLARRTSAVLTSIVQHTTASTPAQLIQQLLARLDRLRITPPVHHGSSLWSRSWVTDRSKRGMNPGKRWEVTCSRRILSDPWNRGMPALARYRNEPRRS